MNVLFISVYYQAFLDSFYKKNKQKVNNFSFDKHRSILLGELFGDSDFYSSGVKENGHESSDIIANDEFLQKKWLKESKIKLFEPPNFFGKLPYLNIIFKPSWVEKILARQIGELSPDILYFHDIEYFRPSFLKKLRKKYFVVAQKASPMWKMKSFKQADLVFTSFPHFVKMFRKNGINSEYLKLAFGEKVLKSIPKQKKKYNCTFVGGISRHHSKGTDTLEKVSEKVDLNIFGYGKNDLNPDSKLYKNHHGEVWGKDMYKILMQSKMTINRHINVAGKYANNMRLFEATGSGTLLLTDFKTNLKDFFKLGKEVVVYKDSDDLIKKIRYYTNHGKECEEIAKAGQKRTLKDHNYTKRMNEMIFLLKKYYKK